MHELITWERKVREVVSQVSFVRSEEFGRVDYTPLNQCGLFLRSDPTLYTDHVNHSVQWPSIEQNS